MWMNVPPEGAAVTPARGRLRYRPALILGCGVLLAWLGSTPAYADDRIPVAPAPETAPFSPDPTNVLERLEQLERRDLYQQQQLETLASENERLTSTLEQLRSRGAESDTRKTSASGELPDVAEDPFRKALLWSSEDGAWTLHFHNETQLDVRAYGHDHTEPVNQFGIYLPRMRMIFNGKLSEPIEYQVSINKGLGNLDLLDAYLNFQLLDERVQFRIGRYRVPFTYGFFVLSNQFLSTHERSVFALNLGYNRNMGAMLHGKLDEGAIDYAVAGVAGPRNSYFDTNANKDVLTYLNFRPFYHDETRPALKHLNVGGSYSYGSQDQTPQPQAFHTSASASSSGGVREGVPSFLELFSQVVERGIRAQWEVHLAYFFKQWTVMGAYGEARNTYGFLAGPGSVPVQARGWHVQAAYLLTGEEQTERSFVEVLRPFRFKSARHGFGAWEVQARFDHFDMDENVFTDGLADPTLWTNSVNTIDTGINWYLNRYVRISFTWQHCLYQDPVVYRPGQSSDTNDLYWLRFQSNF